MPGEEELLGSHSDAFAMLQVHNLLTKSGSSKDYLQPFLTEGARTWKMLAGIDTAYWIVPCRIVLCTIIMAISLAALLCLCHPRRQAVDEHFGDDGTADTQKLESSARPPDADTAQEMPVFGFLLSCLIGKRVQRAEDTMTYDPGTLSGWQPILAQVDTIWGKPALWRVMWRLLAISLTWALTIVTVVPDPDGLKPDRFMKIGTYLNVFVAFLIGIFMSSTLSRWHGCVGAFLEILNSVRNLQMQFHALGYTDKEKMDKCLRYGLMCARILYTELQEASLPESRRAKANQDRWMRFQKGIELEAGTLDTRFSYLLPDECERLKKVEDAKSDVPELMWLWVASVIGILAQEGKIPAMPTPTYGRILNLAMDGQEGIRKVRLNCHVQIPYIYVHTLSMLVHINNIVAAITFGCTLGGFVAQCFVHLKLPYWYHGTTPVSEGDPLMTRVQDLFINFLQCAVGPFLYQAFFEIAISIATPFSDVDGTHGFIPAQRLLSELTRDMHHGDQIAMDPPSWDRCRFGTK